MRPLVLLPLLLAATLGQKCSVPSAERVACAPDKPNDEKACSERKCCFDAKTVGSHQPKCFLPSDFEGYRVTKVNASVDSITASLERQTPSGFPSDVSQLSLKVQALDDSSLRIRITDAKSTRFESPLPRVNVGSKVTDARLYAMELSPEGILSVKRKSNKRTVFESDLRQLVFADQFIQLKTKLASDLVYGIGEHKAPFLKKTDWQLFTLYNADVFPTEEHQPLYGSHPFYLNVEEKASGLTSGHFLLNSHATDVLIQPEPAITWRPIGGIVDLFVFLGSKPEQVVQDYVSLIGRPQLPPFWSLGYHQCRCCPAPGTIEEQQKITERTIAAGIPFDVQWNAKEYMVSFNDFTVDPKWGKFQQFVDNLHARGMHYVPIIDPGIDPAQPKGSYAPFDEGQAMDVFIKKATNKLLIGHCWNKSGKTVWPDFSHPNATKYWTKQFQKFHSEVGIDGAWNDMNEISNVANDGSLDGCPKDDPLDHPPYLPGNRTIYHKTLCGSARQHAGRHYQVHNLYAFHMAIVTDQALKALQKRPFVISRATFAGQGQFSGHWDGDTFSTWDQLAWTVPSVLNFNLFGIPLIGADICGFQGPVSNTTDFQELCARWLQLGAFYPFSRNHNSKKVDQDPVALGQTVTVAARNALRMRYSLLPYLYTLFFTSHTTGSTVARPVFFEFPEDKATFGDVSEKQFLWGSALMICPVLQKNQTKLSAYLPAGQWFPFTEKLDDKPLDSSGQYFELDAPLDKLNVLVRGGHVLPLLPPKQTTTEMRAHNLTLLVALDASHAAKGELFWDDGDSVDSVEHEKYKRVAIEAKEGTLTSAVIGGKGEQKMTADSVIVLGLKQKPSSVKVNGEEHKNFEFSASSEKLSILGLNLKQFLEQKNVIEWK